MIAVTIAVGDAYRNLAAHAAERMRRFTGLPVHVLNEADMIRWISPQDVVRWGPRASMLLKFRLFEVFEADRILYFDADAFACRPWRPESLGTARDFVCTRDLHTSEHIRDECARMGLTPDSYFNSGFFIAGREAHGSLFAAARRRMAASDEAEPAFFEQTYLNLAARDCRVEPRFVDRRFNYLQWRPGDEMAAATPAVLIHAAGAPEAKQLLLDELRQSDRSTGADCDDEAAARLAGRFYIYERVGYDRRRIELRADGTFGRGAADLETHWFVLKPKPGGAPVMVIGNHSQITCELTGAGGQAWAGQWRRHERMPVRVYRHRGQVIADFAHRLAGDGPCDIAEIGVNDGETSATVLQQCPAARLWMVDHWASTPSDSEYGKTNDPLAGRSDEQAEQAFLAAVRSTERWRARRRIIKADEAEAARLIPDRSLDIVFLDADHSLEGTSRAFETWIAKVRPGGILCGHDYGYNPQAFRVAQAVQRCCQARGLSHELSDDDVWSATIGH